MDGRVACLTACMLQCRLMQHTQHLHSMIGSSAAGSRSQTLKAAALYLLSMSSCPVFAAEHEQGTYCVCSLRMVRHEVHDAPAFLDICAHNSLMQYLQGTSKRRHLDVTADMLHVQLQASIRWMQYDCRGQYRVTE